MPDSTKKSPQPREDQVLSRMLAMPPEPHVQPKPKKKPKKAPAQSHARKISPLGKK